MVQVDGIRVIGELMAIPEFSDATESLTNLLAFFKKSDHVIGKSVLGVIQGLPAEPMLFILEFCLVSSSTLLESAINQVAKIEIAFSNSSPSRGCLVTGSALKSRLP
jgi:hypothetical protein